MLGKFALPLAAAFVVSMIGFGTAPKVFAADLPTKAPVRKVLAPASGWTGLYIGAHIGGSFLKSDWTNTNPPGIGSDDADINVSGFLGGGQIGFNYQIDRIVAGIEADGSWTSVNSTASGCYSAFPLLAPQTCKVEADSFATLTGRLGVTWDQTLVYAKGGAAWGHFKYENDCPACLSPNYSTSETRSGWTMGGGIEYALGNNWSVKAEYDYLDFGTKTLTFTGIPGDTFTQDIANRVQIVQVGANYRFGSLTIRYGSERQQRFGQGKTFVA